MLKQKNLFLLLSSFLVVFTGCGSNLSHSSTGLNPKIIDVTKTPYLAVGDGVTDDTAAIQAAVNDAGISGQIVYIPDGTYMINALVSSMNGNHGIALTSNINLQLSSGATLQAIPNSAESYAILFAFHVSNVSISGGVIQGDRNSHKGTTGEWGMGIDIIDSDSVTIRDITIQDCWGDGIYIGGTVGGKNITINNVFSNNNRRQGMSITAADGVIVQNSTFENTYGTAPQNGIDIEPNNGNTVNNIIISGNTITNNTGGGIQSGVPTSYTGTAFVTSIILNGNTLTGNGSATTQGGIQLSNYSGTQVTNNTLSGNINYGILMVNGANNTTCTGNNVSGTTGAPGNGIEANNVSGAVITGNTSTSNTDYGIYSTACTNCTISGNTLSGNGQTQ